MFALLERGSQTAVYRLHSEDNFLVNPIFIQTVNFPVSYEIRRFIIFTTSASHFSPSGSKLTHSLSSHYVSSRSSLVLQPNLPMGRPIKSSSFQFPSKMLSTFLNSHIFYMSSLSLSFAILVHGINNEASNKIFANLM